MPLKALKHIKLHQTMLLGLMLVSGLSAFGPAFVFAKDPSEALMEARRNVFNPKINAVTFRNMADFFPVEMVEPGTPVPLPREPLALNPAVSYGGKDYGFEEALITARTNGFLVIHKGKIVDERYFNGADENSRFTSFSVSKSITSILIGAAIDKGFIKSVDDRLDDYVPELKGTAYDGVTIKQALLMRSGVGFDESYRFDQPNHLAILFDQAMIRNTIRFADFSSLDLKRAGPAGGKFNYSTLESNILGRLVANATGKRLAAFTEEALWQPAGMEASAHWLLDGTPPAGQAIAGGGFNATLRDYGRIGLMMLNEGSIAGQKIVSPQWVAESTIPNGTEPARPGRPQGYQYQWWTLPDSDAYTAKGIHGQFIYVDPVSETVIVKTSYWPGAWIRELENLTLTAFSAVTEQLSNQ